MDSTEPVLKPGPTKLPIKRKIPSSSTVDSSPIKISAVDYTPTPKPPPPFKFHRIWAETDEIHLLRSLLDSKTSDLTTFHNKLVNTTSLSFTKPQLSQKLRRLRKKFRVISSRISLGLNPSLLSPHDRSIFELSNKLWNPNNENPNSNTLNNSSVVEYSKRIDLVGVKVDFSPVLPSSSNDFEPLELNEFDDVEKDANRGGDLVDKNVVVRSVLNVFDECLNEFKGRLAVTKRRIAECDVEKKWNELKVAEIDVFTKRLRLVLENSVGSSSLSVS